MNKKTLHAILILPLITTILVTIDADTQQTPIIIRYIGDVRGGDVFAPHLYDLHFNGVNQYASVPSFTFPQIFTVVLSVKVYPQIPSGFEWVFRHRYPGVWYGTVSLTVEPDLGTTFRICGIDGAEYRLGTSLIYDEDVFTQVAVQHNGSAMRMFKNGVLIKEMSVSVLPMLRTDELWLFQHGGGDMHINMVASSFLIYSRALSNEEISNAMRGVVSASGLRLFIDPTFFDGVKYIDLSGNGNHAYPYNNPSRVPTENPFLWVIRGLYNDNLVRFRFIPEGWHIVVRLLSGEEIIHIDTSYIDAPRVYGFVDNITINIFTPGRYEIIVSSVYPPVEGEMISMVGFGESLAMFILSAVCLATAGIVAGLRKPELLILVSSLYTCVVLIYVFNPCGGLWAISVSIASLSIPIALLITATGNINQNTSIAASIILSLAIYLPSLGLATSSGAIHGSIASIYTGISIGATIIIMSRIFIKSIPRKTIVI
ncbi:MAG: LamG-like jellyroll fold domain-containing protein [Ignisphaera sp.]